MKKKVLKGEMDLTRREKVKLCTEKGLEQTVGVGE